MIGKVSKPAKDMSQRDWIAVQAMVSILAFPNGSDCDIIVSPDVIAGMTYQMADAMLKARSNG